jgi:hypothetical protein
MITSGLGKQLVIVSNLSRTRRGWPAVNCWNGIVAGGRRMVGGALRLRRFKVLSISDLEFFAAWTIGE